MKEDNYFNQFVLIFIFTLLFSTIINKVNPTFLQGFIYLQSTKKNGNRRKTKKYI